MWCFQQNAEQVKNKKVLQRIGTNREIWNMIIKRRVKIIKHNLRHTEIMSLILKGMIEKKKIGKEGKERRRQIFF